jgi:antitoxin CcdA
MTAVAPPSLSRASRPGKRPVNLSLSSDALTTAKRLEVRALRDCDPAPRDLVRQDQERQWRTQHTDFVAAYNTTVDTEGLPLAEWRCF